jgi:transposase-like protein
MFRYKQKYHTGRIPVGERWIFGIGDTSTIPATYFVTLDPDRRAATLIPIIVEVCKPGSVIWSDEWRAYRKIEGFEFVHQTVNHSLNFVNPQNGVNTQTIEYIWNKLKRRLKKKDGVKFGIFKGPSF